MKNFYTMVAGMMSLVAISCSNQSEPAISDSALQGAQLNEPVYVSVLDNSTAPGPELAMLVASNAMQRNGMSSRGASNSEVSTLPDENGEIAAYIVNYENNGGFVVVAADKNLPPVLSHSETGNFNVNDEACEQARQWIEQTVAAYKAAEQLPDSIVASIKAEWITLGTNRQPLELASRSLSEADPYTTMAAAIQQWQSQGYTVYRVANTDVSSFPQQIQTAVNSLNTLPSGEYNVSEKDLAVILVKQTTQPQNYLLKTTWGGEYPYNSTLADRLETIFVGIGCVPISIAQIMKYYGKPNSFNFAAMPNYLSGSTNPTLSNFLVEIGEECGIDYTTVPKGESGKTSSDEAVACLNMNNYNAIFTNYDISVVTEQIRKSYPVIIFGQTNNPEESDYRHAWVADGVYNTSRTAEYQLKVYTGDFADIDPTMAYYTKASASESFAGNNSFHMNWGKAGNYNGWYTTTGPWNVFNHYSPIGAIVDIYYK